MARTTCSRLLPSRLEISAVVLMAGSSLALNGAFSRRLVVPTALVSAVGMLLISRLAGATTEQQGLALESAPRGVRIGVVIGAPVVATMAAAAYIPSTQKFFRDERIIGADGPSALYELFIRMPLATAIGEELMFRSALEGILRSRRSSLQALLTSAALFGIWHTLPALDRLRSNPGARAVHKDNNVLKVVVVTGVCCATAGAAVALSYLRQKTGSVLAPIIVHYAINSGAFAGGWLASRQVTPLSKGIATGRHAL
jgi:CAAX protease family protein